MTTDLRGRPIAAGMILAMSAEPLADLRPGPLKLLLTLRKLAGLSRRLLTYTASLATLCERTANTVRAWRADLEAAGYIHAATDRRTGQTLYLILERAEPPARRAAMAEQRRIDAQPAPLPWQPPRPVILPPDPAPWWRKPAAAFRPKSAACLGGAQFPAPINAKARAPRPGELPRITTEELRALEAKWLGPQQAA